MHHQEYRILEEKNTDPKEPKLEKGRVLGEKKKEDNLFKFRRKNRYK